MRQYLRTYCKFLFFIFSLVQLCNPVLAHEVLADNKAKEAFSKERNVSSLDIENILDSVPCFEKDMPIITDNEWDELEIDDIIIKWKKYTKTRFDIWGVKKLLRFAPGGSKEAIKCLVSDDKIFDLLDKIFEVIKENQDALLSYWEHGNKLHYDAKELYFGKLDKKMSRLSRALNNSQAILEIFQFLEIFKPFVKLFGTLGLGGVLNGFVLSKIFEKPFNLKENIIQGIKEPIRNHTFTPAVYKNENEINIHDRNKIFQFVKFATVADRYIFSKVLINTFLDKFIKNKSVSSVTAQLFAGLTQGLVVAFADYNLMYETKNSIKKISFLYKTTNKLHKNLVSIVSIIKALKKIDELANCYPQLGELEAVKNIIIFLRKEGISNKLKNLLELLETPTFNSYSLIFSKGRLLKAHKLFLEIKEEFIPFLHQVALLGGYRVIANIFRDHEKKRVKFCLVNFVDQKNPYVSLKNGWLPIIDEDKIVPNNIELGVKKGASNAVITGPNGGGKSTSMMMIAFNVLLSKLGIAAADEAYLSNFQKIRTSLHPRATVKSQKSTFMKEQARVKEIQDDIDTCDGNILVLLDEPYKGTFEAESALRVYKFGKDISSIKKCMLLMATHLQKPIDLPEYTDGAFKNLQMGYIQKDEYNFERTFKLEPGPAFWWFNNAKMRSDFIDWLCATES